MAISNIISTLLPYAAIDYVAVFDQDYNQLFRNARAIKAVIKEESKIMEHPLETGAIIIDHRIVLPTEIELSLILLSEDYENVYKQIRSYYYNGTLLVVQTKTGIYENQLIVSMPHDEDPARYDVIALILGLRQVQFATAQYGIVPTNPKNTTTVRRGAQQPTAAEPSAFYNLTFGKIGSGS